MRRHAAFFMPALLIIYARTRAHATIITEWSIQSPEGPLTCGRVVTMDRSMMRKSVRGLTTYYNPDVGNAIRMDTNVNVLGSNPAAEAYIEGLRINTNTYPNTYSDGLRDALADLYGTTSWSGTAATR